MKPRLVSDGTTVTLLLLAHETTALDQDDTETLSRAVLQERYADALEIVRREASGPRGKELAPLLSAIDEANDEAARTHQGREILDDVNAALASVRHDPEDVIVLDPNRVEVTKRAIGMFAKSIALLELELDAQRSQHDDLVDELAKLERRPGPSASSGAVLGKIVMSGEAVLLDGTRLDLSDPEAMKRAADAVRAPFLANFTELVPPPPSVFTDEMEARLLKSERDEARAERDGLREQLAAAKKKLQGVMYGGKRRRS